MSGTNFIGLSTAFNPASETYFGMVVGGTSSSWQYTITGTLIGQVGYSNFVIMVD